MKHLATPLALLCLCAPLAAQPSSYNYDEAKVPKFDLPDPLVTEDGKKVHDAKTWRDVRRPEIFRLFQQHVYGKSPRPPAQTHYKVFDDSASAREGAPRRKQVSISLNGKKDGPRMDLLLYLPPKGDGPHPVFLTLNFRGNHSISDDAGVRITQSWVPNEKGIKDHKATEATRGLRASRWDVSQITSRGYALGTIYCGDIEPDHRNGRQDGIRARYPDSYTWSAIGAWAWGLSRGLDYLEKDKDIDASKAIVMGHSRLGKTALWAGASDPRFAITISNNSGCGGAALSRRRFGETVKRINTSFPHWFVDQYKTYNDNEAACPVDQHQLAALVAPRPLYIASAEQDRWADPRGEFLSAKHAAPVYELLQAGTLPAKDLPPIDKPVHGVIGYHIRSGKHDVTPFDWKAYLDFADKHFK
jgi:hypothetical protein